MQIKEPENFRLWHETMLTEFRLKAELEPRKELSIIVDGMDQAKTNIPHVTNITKSHNIVFSTVHYVAQRLLLVQGGTTT